MVVSLVNTGNAKTRLGRRSKMIDRKVAGYQFVKVLRGSVLSAALHKRFDFVVDALFYR